MPTATGSKGASHGKWANADGHELQIALRQVFGVHKDEKMQKKRAGSRVGARGHAP